jgi:hypothetical protein
MAVTSEDIQRVANLLYTNLYEQEFRGKNRGRFALTRDQLKHALGVKNLHPPTTRRLQDAALDLGLAIIDLDDLFACVEVDVLRKYRRPPRTIFDAVFEPREREVTAESDGEEEDD